MVQPHELALDGILPVLSVREVRRCVLDGADIPELDDTRGGASDEEATISGTRGVKRGKTAVLVFREVEQRTGVRAGVPEAQGVVVGASGVEVVVEEADSVGDCRAWDMQRAQDLAGLTRVIDHFQDAVLLGTIAVGLDEGVKRGRETEVGHGEVVWPHVRVHRGEGGCWTHHLLDDVNGDFDSVAEPGEGTVLGHRNNGAVVRAVKVAHLGDSLTKVRPLGGEPLVFHLLERTGKAGLLVVLLLRFLPILSILLPGFLYSPAFARPAILWVKRFERQLAVHLKYIAPLGVQHARRQCPLLLVGDNLAAKRDGLVVVDHIVNAHGEIGLHRGQMVV